MAVGSDCARSDCVKRVTRKELRKQLRKKTKFFLRPLSCSEGSGVASGGRMWPGVTSEGHGLPQGVACGLKGSRVASGALE
jgi:hypothetical protein